MIQLVRQLDKSGCGVACLAMLLSVSYEEAKMRLFGRRPTEATDMRMINRELRRAGFGTKFDWFRRDRPCLVPLAWAKSLGGHGHFVVWDPAQPGVYLDPDGTKPRIGNVDVATARRIAARDGEPLLVVKV